MILVKSLILPSLFLNLSNLSNSSTINTSFFYSDLIEILYLSVKLVIYLTSKNTLKRNTLFAYHLLIFSRAS